ncbi:MAG TPA: ribosome maturation factor RimM, partial [Vicinamibacteria bacterium]|nr:ribosome maturation factor RimM [Vicinamibacteria bacterium]
IYADMITIGVVVKPQGRKGEVLVALLSDRPDRFTSLQRVFVPVPGTPGAQPVTVTDRWPHKGRFVLKFEGVDSIDAAETYRGIELRIGEDEVEALPAGSYYHYQLKGLKVEDPAGHVLGTAADVLVTGGEAPVLVVRGGARGEVLIPMAEAFIREVDLEHGRIVAIDPESTQRS